jgi:hypothetical protein
MEDEFPGSEDYEDGCDPVRELTLLEQIEYWKRRAFEFEKLAHERGELTHGDPPSRCYGAAGDPADFWKR